MRLKIITLTNQLNHPGFLKLKASLDHFGYDWHCIETEWKGFGTKIIETAKYLETIRNKYSHFIFVDAHDSFVLFPESFVIEELPLNYGLLSVEKNCWPVQDLVKNYPCTSSEWKYVNSGNYFMPIWMFLEIVKLFPIDYADDDQLWLTRVYLSHRYALHLDYDCTIFQSLAFKADDDYKYKTYSIYNLKTDTFPVFFHKNGGTIDEEADRVLNNALK